MAWSDVETAWLAGLLEGEGTFCSFWGHQSGGRVLRSYVSLEMSDLDIVRRAAEMTGCRTVVEIAPRKPGRKTTYQISLRGAEAIALMLRVEPLMGERRRDAIWRAVADWTDYQFTICAACGDEFLNPVRKGRPKRCDACSNSYAIRRRSKSPACIGART